MPQAGREIVPQARKRRANIACDFCRRRKLKCDNEEPRCNNCVTHQKSCTYAERVKHERPSKSRMDQLQAENARLRGLIATLQPGEHVLTPDSEQDSHVRETGRNAPPTSPARGGNVFEDRPTSAGPPPTPSTGDPGTGRIHFYGPTSALHDGELASAMRKTMPIISADVSHKTQLLAETAKQRQLERINFRSGKLDFDGVNPEIGMELLNVFFNRQHATGSLVYRPCFMRDMACQGPFFSRILLNAIYFVALKHAPLLAARLGNDADLNRKCTAAGPFRQKVEEGLYEDRTITISRITTIQALLLMSDALFSWCDERSLSWHYLGIATTMITDLGMHSENHSSESRTPYTLEEVEIRRRVFWAAFVFDKIQSIYQGRPARLRNTDRSVPIVFMDEHEELDEFNTLGYSAQAQWLGQPTHSVSTFKALCKLSILADYICNLYAENLSISDRSSAKSLHMALIQWRESLPKHLAADFDLGNDVIRSDGYVPLPHILSLISMYHALTILLHRPFLSEAQPFSHTPSSSSMPTTAASSEARAICTRAAADIDAILRVYKTHWCILSPPYFISYATYVSATVHVRIAAAQTCEESDAHRRFRTCLEVLSQHQNVCRAPGHALRILLGLAGRLGVEVGSEFATVVGARVASCEVGRQALDDAMPAAHDCVLRGAVRCESGLRNARPTGGDLTQVEETPMTSPGETGVEVQIQGSEIDGCSPHLPDDWLNNMVVPDMYFDLDPLFGFQDVRFSVGDEGDFMT